MAILKEVPAHRIRSFPLALLRWVFEAKLAGFSAMAMLLPFALLFWFAPSERYFRLSGLALQLFGMCTVLWGMHKTRKEFSLDSIFGRGKRWLARRPRLRYRPVGADMTVQLEGVSGQAYAETTFEPHGTIDERLALIQGELQAQKRRVTEIERSISARLREHEHKLQHERMLREAEDVKLNEKLKTAHTGGLLASFNGALWLTWGALLSTASTEFQCLFASRGTTQILKCFGL